AGLTGKWMISVSVEANRPLIDLLTPGTPTATPAPARRITARNTQSLLPDDFRRGGRWASGRSRACGCGGEVAVEGLCREKFMEGLPLIVRQGAEVAVELQSLELVLLPA